MALSLPLNVKALVVGFIISGSAMALLYKVCYA